MASERKDEIERSNGESAETWGGGHPVRAGLIVFAVFVLGAIAVKGTIRYVQSRPRQQPVANSVNVQLPAPVKNENIDSQPDDEPHTVTAAPSAQPEAAPAPVVIEPAPSQGTVQEFDGMTFAWCPAGAFNMGSDLGPNEIAARYGGESAGFPDQPQHRVEFTHGFWMGRYEVTNSDFGRFVDAERYVTEAERSGGGTALLGGRWNRQAQGVSWRNPGWNIRPDHPVVMVSWNDAQAFTAWLNRNSTSGGYRLPGEAEWEYACRAGSETTFSWGNSVNDTRPLCNGSDRSAQATYPDWGNSRQGYFNWNDGAVFTAPVGEYPTNAWNLSDMHGNVWEWCQDSGGTYSARSMTDPAPVTTGNEHVMRGGGWDDVVRCRSAQRFWRDASHRGSFLGFRLMKTSTVSKERATQ